MWKTRVATQSCENENRDLIMWESGQRCDTIKSEVAIDEENVEKYVISEKLTTKIERDKNPQWWWHEKSGTRLLWYRQEREKKMNRDHYCCD